MRSHPVLAALLLQAARFYAWARHLGGIGLLPLGVFDSAVIPFPGTLDAATLLLSSNERQWWPYYAAMATLGSLAGGYATYHLAARGGQNRLARKFLFHLRLEKVYAVFRRFGFWAIALPGVLPPPVPIKPSLVAAGATHYPRQKFLWALGVSRATRYAILAWLGAEYGPARGLSAYAVAILIATGAMAAVLGMIKLFRRGHGEHVTLR